MDTKRCSRCHQKLPLAQFGKNKRNPDGLARYCKSCKKAYRDADYKKHRKKRLSAVKKRAEEKKDEIAIYQEWYRKENREKLNADARAYRRIPKVKAHYQEYDKAHPNTPEENRAVWERTKQRMEEDPEFRARYQEAQRRSHNKWYANNRDLIIRRAHVRYHKDLEKSRAKSRKSVARWRKQHPERARALVSQRTALRKKATMRGFDQEAHVRHLLKWQRGLCYHCNRPHGESYHIDHLFPVCKGGEHNSSNLAISCGLCNQSKHGKLLHEEWSPERVDIPWEPLLPEEGVAVIPTFLASHRNDPDCAKKIAALHEKYPLVFWDYEWGERQGAIQNMLAAKRGQAPSIGARKTELVELRLEDARQFLDTYHLQGWGSGSLYLGLVYEDTLVGVSAWRCGENIELSRMAFKGHVQGGFSKMLQEIIRNHLQPDMTIFSYVDPRYADGSSYLKVGFDEIAPSMSPWHGYVTPAGVVHRMAYRKGSLERRGRLLAPEKTGEFNASILGAYKLVGLPQKRFRLTL